MGTERGWEVIETLGSKQYTERITHEDLEILERQDDKTLAHWSCELNSWRWPKELSNEEATVIKPFCSTRRHALMAWIEQKVGRKEVLRTHWERSFFDMSEFEEFWHIHHEDAGSEEVEAYYARCEQKHRDKFHLPSLTGRSRAYYGELRDRKKKELGHELFGSVSFCKRKMFSSVEWVNVFNEHERHNSVEAIEAHYRKLFDGKNGMDVVLCEYDDDEFRVWLADTK